MSTFIKSSVAGLAMIIGAASVAYAQTTPNVANLPPQGPRAASNTTIPATPTASVPVSPKYVGPAPGAGEGSAGSRYEKPADWDTRADLHPYTSGMGPKPH
jgi:hypothetical protein